VALFDQLGEANFQAEVLSLSASEDSVVDVHRGWVLSQLETEGLHPL
jgi:hypothetical protein